MSSLHQDRLHLEGSGPATGARTTLPTARGTSRRAAGSTEEKATSKVPTQRQGTAQGTGTIQITTDAPAAPRAKRATGARAAALSGTLASRAKAATVKAATAKAATAKAATVKVATAKAATAKAATAKAATAARAAAVTTVANHTPGVRSARAAAAASAKVAATRKPATAKTAPKAAAGGTADATSTPAAKAAPAAKPAPAAKATTKGAPVTSAPATSAPARTAAAGPVAGPPAAKGPSAKPAAKSAPVATAVVAEVPVAKAPAAKATVAKATVVKAPVAETSAAKAPVAKAAVAKASVTKAPAVKAPAAKAVDATSSRATSTPAGEVAPGTARVRPTPHKRVAAPGSALSGLVPLTDVAALGTAEAAEVVVVRKDLPAAPEQTPAGTESRLPLFLRRRERPARRRPAVYLTAAIVTAVSLGTFSAEEPTAQATATATMSQPVSVAEQLGIEADPTAAVVDADVTERLGELAASRNIRDAEQAAAAQVQAEADRVAAAAAAEAARPKAVLPVNGARLTSGFGARWGTLHAGIDLAAPMHTPEYAAMDGVVLEAGPASGYGLVVYIQHENGDVTVYGHMDEILVQAGQVVRAGDTIALLGNRGQSTGPHLHFEVHVGGIDGQKIDPLPWLRDKGVAV
jgi:murein DD-endopeptidase MepM/ murein hydrolase activator NlpD